MMNNDDLIKLTEHFIEIRSWHHYSHKYDSIRGVMDENELKKAWCNEHLKGRYQNYFTLWYFEKEDDYLLFLMRWS